jgi:branched-chain amino acid transport system substrate-binding protein
MTSMKEAVRRPAKTVTRAAGITVALTVGLALAACGSGSGSLAASSSSGLPSTIKVYGDLELTGNLSSIGTSNQNALNLAASEINASGMLGKSKIKMTYGDAESTPTQGASLANAALHGGYAAIFGSAASKDVLAEAGVVSHAKQITLFTQGGVDGVLVNPYIFRMTVLQPSIFPLTAAYLQSKHVKTVAAIYNSDLPATKVVLDALNANAAKYGYKVVGSTTVPTTTSNISSGITKVLGFHADALLVSLTTSQVATAATLIHQAGFTGPIVSGQGSDNNALAPAGAAASGWTWATDWSPAVKTSASAKFVADYTKKYGQQPGAFAVEAYDEMYFFAHGLVKAKSVDPDKLAAALTAVGAEGFSGVTADKITVIKNQEQAHGVLVQWQGSATKTVSLAK